MDNIFRRSLIIFSLAFLSFFPFVAVDASTASYPSYSSAMAACQHYAATGGYYAGLPAHSPTDCRDGVYSGLNSVDLWWCDPRNGHSGCSPDRIKYNFTYDVADCSSEPSQHYGSTNLSGDVTTCYHGCLFGFTPDAGQVQVCLGDHCSSGQSGTIGPTGAQCIGAGTGPTPGNYTPPPKPKLCGGGSCYDPGSGQYCAVTAGGHQVCVSARDAADHGATATAPDGAITAGNPPPKPPNPPIIDPPTDISASNQFQQSTTDADGNPGPGQNITVNTYGKGGTQTTSGQGEGDDGPAHASSTAGGGSVSGGGDCNTPPICSGDAVNCAIVDQSWLARCHNHDDLEQIHDDLTTDPGIEKPAPVSQGDVWTDDDGVGSDIARQALQGHFDESGLGFSSACPLHDMTIALPGGHSFDIPFSKGCEFGAWIRAVVIAFALFSAAKIVTGGRG